MKRLDFVLFFFTVNYLLSIEILPAWLTVLLLYQHKHKTDDMTDLYGCPYIDVKCALEWNLSGISFMKKLNRFIETFYMFFVATCTKK